MPNRREKYADKEKYKKTRKEQSRRYHHKSQLYERRDWRSDEELLVLEHRIPDSQLSILIQRSIGAIQTKRCDLRKKKDLPEE